MRTFTTILKDCVGLIEWAIEDDDVILVGTFNMHFCCSSHAANSTVVLLPPTIHSKIQIQYTSIHYAVTYCTVPASLLFN